MPGAGIRIWNACADLYGEDVAASVAAKKPGVVVRTRLGSVGDIGAIIKNGHPYLGQTFEQVFQTNVQFKRARKVPAARVLSPLAEAAGFAEKKRGGIARSIYGLQNCLFNVMVFVSHVVHSPMRHFHLWVQKTNGNFNKQSAANRDVAYFGPTMMSELVSWPNRSVSEKDHVSL